MDKENITNYISHDCGAANYEAIQTEHYNWESEFVTTRSTEAHKMWYTHCQGHSL